MACCLMFFSDDPIDGDAKSGRPNRFQLSLMDGLTHNQPWCLLTFLCPPCATYYSRYRVLDGDMSRYTCCQGYLNCACFKAGTMGESSCPEVCLALESCLCLGPAMSSSRLLVMDTYSLRPDPCDNRLVRLSNCLQMLSCACHLLAIFVKELRHVADYVRLAAHLVFYTMLGCMAAQVNYEVDYQRGALLESSLTGHATSAMNPVHAVAVEDFPSAPPKDGYSKVDL